MRPIDFRNTTYHDLVAQSAASNRLAVLSAWRQHGPCTTRELAERSGIDLLHLRPRTTELVQLGFVGLVEDELQTTPGAGVYRALSEEESLEYFRTMQEAAHQEAEQLQLKARRDAMPAAATVSQTFP